MPPYGEILRGLKRKLSLSQSLGQSQREVIMQATDSGSISFIVDRLGIEEPVIGFYDAPDPAPFAPLVRPGAGGRTCIWAFYDRWRQGDTLYLTEDRCGCRGCGRALFGVEMPDREEFLTFLADEEGLKASTRLMGRWLDAHPPYGRRHDHLLIGPLDPDQEEYLVTATFLADPDHLSGLVIGAHYHATPDDPTPVLTDFGSGCMELVDPFVDLDVAQAAVGATDLAMRRYLPPQILAFTVTRPMLARLASLDEHSFLSRRFLADLHEARRQS
jgi:COG2043 family uncharacterized protein